MKADKVAKFHSKTTRLAEWGCILWIGSITERGYGVFSHRRKAIAAHRFSYELVHGPIPSGYVIDHVCRNTRCVNPEHLEAVTVLENTMRGVGPAAQNAQKTRCHKGHELEPHQVPGWRKCRTCENFNRRIRDRAKAKAKALQGDGR